MSKKPGIKKNPKIREEREFEQEIIDLARVTRVMAGGKRMRFRACVAIGNKKGKIGLGMAKGADVTIAINKAVNKAKKNIILVKPVNETIPFMVRKKFKAAKILLKPIAKGTGIKAGGSIRQILELTNIGNVSAKILGSNNKINNAFATFEALKELRKIDVPEKKSKKDEFKEKNKTGKEEKAN